ncbi:MAG: hypothetical protein GMKNLPBB_01194 [Myxococcota bacterium]|nr:hypothetical protein [Myxococcota bacterium]
MIQPSHFPARDEQARPAGRERAIFLCAAALALWTLGVSAISDASGHSHGPATQPALIQGLDPAVHPDQLPASAPVHAVYILCVDDAGSVSSVQVATPAGPVLDDAFKAAARQWRFQPAMVDGKPVVSHISVHYAFQPREAVRDQGAPAAVATHTHPAGDPHHGHWSEDPHHSHEAGPGAATAASATAPAAAEPLEADLPITVVGRKEPPSRGASDFNLRVGELGRVPRLNGAQLLQLAPGILLTNEGGDGHAHQIFLRGFDAREGQDIEFSAAGVPLNEVGNPHGNGYADLNFIIPELVLNLRVVEGPYDPHQGNFAVAGSAEYELGMTKRGLMTKYMTGSFNTHRLAAAWGPGGESEGTFGGAELFTSDGFGRNRDSKRGSVIGQYEGKLGAKGLYRLGFSGYAADYRSAGVLREDEYLAGRVDFFGTHDPNQGGDAQRFSLWAGLDAAAKSVAFHQLMWLTFRGMRVRENFTGFLLDVQEPRQRPHGQRGDLLDSDSTAWTIGGKGSARLHKTWLGQVQELELGYFARYDLVDAIQMRVQGANNIPYSRETDYHAKLADISLFADGNLRPLEWLTLRGGVRAGLYTFNILNRCAVDDVRRPSRPPGDASCLDQQDFGYYRDPAQRANTSGLAVMPRAALLLGPWWGITPSFSYGHGVRSIDPAYIIQDSTTPFAGIRAYEGGLTWRGVTPDMEILVRGAGFVTQVERDYIFSETAGRPVIGGGTTRVGAMTSLRLTGRHFDQAANATFVHSTFDDTGLLVPYNPDLVLRSDTAAFTDFPWTLAGEKTGGALSMGITWVGKRPLPFDTRGDAIFTIDASATLSWWIWEAGVMATNLLDNRYRLGEYNFASSFTQQGAPSLVPARHFAAGAPRAIYFVLTMLIPAEDES